MDFPHRHLYAASKDQHWQLATVRGIGAAGLVLLPGPREPVGIFGLDQSPQRGEAAVEARTRRQRENAGVGSGISLASLETDA